MTPARAAAWGPGDPSGRGSSLGAGHGLVDLPAVDQPGAPHDNVAQPGAPISRDGAAHRPGELAGELLGVAIEAAHEAGHALLERRGHARAVGTKSSVTDMVSDADRAAEGLIRSCVARRRPDDTVLGEEGGGATEPSRAGTVRWIVDPLDGTTNYLYGFPAWAVSVAAEHEGSVLAGVVLDPLRDELWTATRGGGAWCNDARLVGLQDRGELATALVATGFSYQAHQREDQGRVVAHLLPRVRDIRRAGAAALDLCWLAAGRVDAYYERGTHVWDWAAGALIAREAGAWVGGFDGGPPSIDGLLAARPTLAGELRTLLRQAGASG